MGDAKAISNCSSSNLNEEYGATVRGTAGGKGGSWGTYAAVALERVLLVVDVERVAEAQRSHAVAQAALTLRKRITSESVELIASVRPRSFRNISLSADYSSCS